MEAIERNDYSLAVRAMEAGVNPNAKVDGETSLFIQAFRHAIEYDENGDISGINSQASDIARHLANLGGDLTALDKELTEYLDVAGVPQLRKFASARAAIAFKTFVKHLKNIGAAAKG
jgi:gamma-glutamylcysteine synthetase